MRWEFYSEEKFECPECGEDRFVRMVNENGEFYPPQVGRCDREDSCGYMYHASAYLKDNPQAAKNFKYGKVQKPKKRVIDGYYSFPLVLYDLMKKNGVQQRERMKSEYNYVSEFSSYLKEQHNFTDAFLRQKMDEYKIIECTNRYRQIFEDQSDKYVDITYLLYFYVSISNEIRAIEKIHYDGFKRSKRHSNEILNKQLHYFAGLNYNINTTEINWCLFGEHLLNIFPEKPIIVVEGVKTAFGMSLFYPQFNWLATGSSNRLIHLNFKTDHTVQFLPDAGYLNDKSYCNIWNDKIKKMYGVYFRYYVHDFNFDCSTDEINDGCGILDIQLKDPDRSEDIIDSLFK